MKAIVWHGAEEYRLESVPDPRRSPRQVLVKVEVTAVYGSDPASRRFPRHTAGDPRSRGERHGGAMRGGSATPFSGGQGHA